MISKYFILLATLNGVVSFAQNSEVAQLTPKADGTVVAWGQIGSPKGFEQKNGYYTSSRYTDLRSIAAGVNQVIALRDDGTLIELAGGSTVQIPSKVGKIEAIASGRYFMLALGDDGKVTAWGSNLSGQINVPDGLSNVKAIAAGSSHALALKDDGTIVAWGSNEFGQTNVPTVFLSNVIAIAAGANHSMALNQDGTVVGWGSNYSNQIDVPSNLVDVQQICVAGNRSLALKKDGTIVAWGSNDSNQSSVPAGLTGIQSIAVGPFHSLALKVDGTVVAWGKNDVGQTTVPAALNQENIGAIMVGENSSFALRFSVSEIARRKALANYPELFVSKGEFETTKQFQERKVNRGKLVAEYKAEIQNALEMAKLNEVEQMRLTILNSITTVVLTISSIGAYDADNHQFQIIVNGKSFTIDIPLEEAPSFKKEFKSALVVGTELLDNDLQTKVMVNMKVTHPTLGSTYSVGNQLDLSRYDSPIETSMTSPSTKLLPANLSATISFSDPNQNGLVDADETCYLVYKVNNKGNGPAQGFAITLDGISDPSVIFKKDYYIGTILKGDMREIRIPVVASHNIKKNTYTINITSREQSGYLADPVMVRFESNPYQPPQVELVDSGVSDPEGLGIVKTSTVTQITTRFRNVGKGQANNLVFTIRLPVNINPAPESKYVFEHRELASGAFVDLSFSIIANRLVNNTETITIDVVEKFGRKSIPLSIQINKPTRTINEVVVQSRSMNDKFQIGDELSIDIEREIPIATTKKPDAIGLVLAVSDYANPSVPKVEYAKRDAKLIREYLVQTLGYSSNNVFPRNFDEFLTAGSMKNYIRNILPNVLKPDGSSELFIYFVGHGAPAMSSKEAYFVPYDADPNYLSDDNAYNVNQFYADVAKLKAASKIVVVDACFSGRAGDGTMLIRNASPVTVKPKWISILLSENTIVFQSSGPEQVSNWYPEKKHSMFTYFFLKGLKGGADLNKDGKITKSEMGLFINDPNNGLVYYSNREFQRRQEAVISGKDDFIVREK